MLIVGISTSSGQFALLLGENNQVIYDSSEYKKDDNRELYSLLQDALNNCNKKISDIHHIIVDSGPGGTSRVRTGVAFANSLAYSLNIPVSPVSSMELAGIDTYNQYGLPVVNSVKSIKGNAYIGFYQQGTEDVKIEYGRIEEIVPALTGRIDRFVVVGVHREQIISLPALAGKIIIDSEMQYGNARIFIEKSDLFTGRGLRFPQFATPITEQTMGS
jgi:tRNA A37 threonylcarbamoyladenosine modification protein TsaB